MNIQTTLLFVSFVATVLLGFIVVPILKKKKIGQVVREAGPKSHLQKNGTPIMSGIIIILVVTVILAFFVKDYPILIMPMVAIFGYGVVGFLDDFKKLILKDPEGMSPKMKMLGLFIVTAILNEDFDPIKICEQIVDENIVSSGINLTFVPVLLVLPKRCNGISNFPPSLNLIKCS